MMKLIDEIIFEKLSNLVENIEIIKSEDNQVKKNLRNYILLEKFPEKFENETTLNLFYNKYYFFLSYSYFIQKNNGFDAGLEQQELKILEQGDYFKDIDWRVVEDISNRIKGSDELS
nr:hypothetical protein [uncultured Allomuricauda sp.]